ncbi:unnamed protein product [Paramecium pentaurelia]|uniref:Uncharacterized protein n=1 Tax=Paramecium pentaurelia TaxID=43138 RepID=A0A8S1U8B2_9CILI|nr:unnamed protein product [Paramecium pentaurelia]
MLQIFVFSILSQLTFGFNVLKPSFVERNRVEMSFSQRMSYNFGNNFNMYTSEGVVINDNSIQFEKPGRLVMNIPLVEGIDYALQFKLNSLNANHIACIGIGSQGFILSEVLGIEKTNLSHFQLGYCSDGTNSTQYPDMYTDFNEFDYYSDEEFDEIDYSFGESQMTNVFGQKEFYMVLRERQLIFMDNEDSILTIFNDLDRARAFVPIITMHYRNEIQKKLIKKRECVVKEEYAILLQLVGQLNPFKREMPPEMKAQKEQEKKKKETDLAKMLKQKQDENENEDENQQEEEQEKKEEKEVTDEDIKKEQQDAIKRSEETKKMHEETQNQGEESNDQATMAITQGEEENISEENALNQQDDLLEGEEGQLIDQQNDGEKGEKEEENKSDQIINKGDQQNENELTDEQQAQKNDGNQQDTQQDQISIDGDQNQSENQQLEDQGEFQSSEQNEQQMKPEDDTTESIASVLDIQSHIIYATQFTREIVPLRNSVVVENKYTVFQDNQRLAKPLQDYKSCGYSYLDIRPSQNNFFVQIQIDNIDDLYDAYPIGFGVYAYQMLDRLKGWRNLDDQLWCIDKESEDLWQFGALYRSDGTFIDSYMFGEYFKYKVDKQAQRQTKINIYFSNKNRVAFSFDDDKTIMLTCVNPKFKYYVPIFETKAYKGVPSMTLLQYIDDIQIPFEYSDSIENIQNAFSKIFSLINKFIIEKRGSFNEDDDDYTISGIDDTKSASINMWDIKLYDSQYEWWIKIDDLKQDKQDINMCIGINQMSSEEIITNLFDKQYKAQVAYICDKNDFIHTFFQECPISSNPILFVPGTVLRFRLSDYLMEVYDGYQFAYFSLRKAGKTGVIPSAIIRSDSKNKITFLKGPINFGPNPLADRVDYEQLNRENFASYDIFTFPILENAKNGLFKSNTNEPLFKKNQIPKPGKREPPLGRNYDIEQEDQKIEEQISNQEQNQEVEKKNENENEESQKLTSSNVPTEAHADIYGDTNVKCLIIYEHCDFEGPSKLLYPNRFEAGPPNEFRSFELCRDTKLIEIIIEGHVQEKMFVSQSVECLPSPFFVDEIIII